ncbi:hypothetical protein Thiowin_00472 [Thiorhodovibrio winogradskyi]|uniref:IrrE N-terminal-like domain-containing protein n=1 Tax=Thiorhodovibrio winogradskyi TaxID=77007 RepID=A0ABZ0S5M7_9GAMM|nr:ImmA/IrrE family metallo-endopeptidase [Thiorhodovibrio winogradskyi]
MADSPETVEVPEQEIAQSLLGELLEKSRSYHKSDAFKELLDFAVKLRNFAPFNAFLLHLQRPGLRFAASAYDWAERHGRSIKEGACPLIILWPFGPVALVYDIADTEGPPLPAAVANAFSASGKIDSQHMTRFAKRLGNRGIDVRFIAYGDGLAGFVQPATEQPMQAVRRSKSDKEKPDYRVRVNANHDPNVQFATLAHELAHLYLGHLGADTYLKIPDRSQAKHNQQELEAEAVSYLVCRRNGISSQSEQYLADYVREHTSVEKMDLDAILRSAGQIEALLGIGEQTRFGPRKPGKKRPKSAKT